MRPPPTDDLGIRLRDCWMRVGGSGFQVRPGATQAEFSGFEAFHRLTLPDDVRGYLSVVNGMKPDDSDNEITSFWGLDRMKPIAEVYTCTSPHPRSRDDFVLCDVIIDSFWYAIRLRPAGPDVGRVLMWGVRDFPIVVAESFSSFAEAYLLDRGGVPHGLPAIEEPTTCPVHGSSMTRRTIGHRYGPRPDAALGVYEAAVRGFPFSGDGRWEGKQEPARPHTWIEPVCDRCASTRAEWVAAHPRGS